MFYWLCGVRKPHFIYIYTTYCGFGTMINSHHKLFILLRWYKQYPRGREFGNQIGVLQHGTRLVHDIKRWSAWLAGAINNREILINWHARFESRNKLPVPDELFGGQVTGCLDTFPIYLCKPKDSVWQKMTYQGKYGANVLKVQMIVDNTGTPIWYSGPHLGTWHDIRLARQHMPDGLQPTERMLADKAYCATDMPHLSAPHKKARRKRQKRGQTEPPPPPPLTRRQHAFNRVSHTSHVTMELLDRCCD